MKHGFSRGFVLRGSSLSLIGVMMLATVIIPAQAVERTDPGLLQKPATVWVPPASVNRTPSGGPTPGTPWGGPGSAAAARVSSVPCSTALGTGIMKHYPMEQFPLSDRSELRVNTANGNVVVTARDLSIKGTGENLSMSHVYNSRIDGGGSLGAGWSLNTGFDLGLTFDGADAILHGESGYCARFTSTGNGNFKPAPGLPAEFRKASNNNYELVFNGSNEKWTFSPFGWLQSQADRNLNTISMRYNGDGTLASVIDTQSRVTNFAYDGDKHITTITDPTGTTAARYSYSEGKLTGYADRDGQATNLSYDAAGNLRAITDPLGGRTLLDYDATDRVTRIQIPGQSTQATTMFAYGDKQTTETDANGNKIVFTYDDQGRQLKATDALGHVQSRTWNANSDVQITTDGLASNTTRGYDTFNNLTNITLPTGAASTVGYAKAGQPHLPSSEKDPQGNELIRDYDGSGNLTKIRSTALNADVQVNTYDSPQHNLIARKDGNGHTTTYGYDPAGNLISVTPSAPARPEYYTYDSLSRITSMTDGRGERLDYDYDRLDRVVAITRHNDNTVQQVNAYDKIGNLTKLAFGQVTTTYQWSKTSVASVPISVQRQANGATETTRYDYDQVGNTLSVKDTSGTTTYGYDAAYRLTSLTDAFGQTTTFGYDNADHRTSTTYPGAGKTSLVLDKSGRQTSLTVTNTAGTEKLKATYSYQRDGKDSDQLQTKTIAGVTTNYTYDGYRRLTKAGTTTYTADNANNLTTGDGHTFTVNDADQLTRADTITFTSDGAGNRLDSSNPPTHATYSPTNQLQTLTGGSDALYSSTYDTSDQTQPREITETAGDGTIYRHSLRRSAFGVTQTTDNGAITRYSRDTEGNLATLATQTGIRYNAVTDYQGSVLALLDTGGNIAATYTYTPYGATTIAGPAAAANPFRWIGGYQTKLESYLLGYRQYVPAYGRFFQTDPTGQEANNYTYGANDPINTSDPTGAYGLSNILGNLGGYLGATVTAGLVAAACGASFGVGCAIGAVVGGAVVGGTTSGLGSVIGGGRGSTVRDAVFDGATGGLLGGSGMGRSLLKARR